MPAPKREINDTFYRVLERECEYDHQELDLAVQTDVPVLNIQRKEMVIYIFWMPLVELVRHSSCQFLSTVHARSIL